MPHFDYNAPAELFLAKRTPKAFGASLEIGDERFIANPTLYEAADYPLRRT